MRAEVLTKESAFRAVATEWDALVDRLDDGLFLSFDWLDAWWAHYGARWGDELHVVVFRDSSGAAVGLAPLYRSRPSNRPPEGAGAVRAATLRFIGTGGDTSPDHLGLVARPGHEREIAEAFADHLAGPARGEWDALSLHELPEDGAMTSELGRALAQRLGMAAAVRFAPRAVCPYVDLPPPGQGGTCGSAKLRSNVRRRRAKLEKEHQAAFFDWDESRGTARAGIDHLAALHRRRFEEKGERHGFSSEAYVGFHREVAERFRRRGRLRLHCLEAGGSLVAMLYCFSFGRRVSHFQSGFDPEWKGAGVGQVLVAHALDQAIAGGAARFDFLKGEYPYKSEWATGSRRTTTLTAGRLNKGGLLHLYETFVRPGLAGLARGILR